MKHQWLIASICLVLAPVLYLVPDRDAAAADSVEYKVIILQGITAGGSVEKESDNVYVDTLRTRALNELAADGWEVVAVVGQLGTDHMVYLQRVAPD